MMTRGFDLAIDYSSVICLLEALQALTQAAFQ